MQRPRPTVTASQRSALTPAPDRYDDTDRSSSLSSGDPRFRPGIFACLAVSRRGFAVSVVDKHESDRAKSCPVGNGRWQALVCAAARHELPSDVAEQRNLTRRRGHAAGPPELVVAYSGNSSSSGRSRCSARRWRSDGHARRWPLSTCVSKGGTRPTARAQAVCVSPRSARAILTGWTSGKAPPRPGLRTRVSQWRGFERECPLPVPPSAKRALGYQLIGRYRPVPSRGWMLPARCSMRSGLRLCARS